MRAHNSNSLDRDLNSILHLAQRGFAEPLFTFNQNGIDSFGKSLLEEFPDLIVTIKLSDRNKRPLFSGTGELGTPDHSEPALDESLFVKAQGNVVFEGSTLGEVEIVLTGAKYSSLTKQWTFGLVLFTLVITLLFGLINHFELNRLLTKPLKALLEGLRRLEQGDYQSHLDSQFSFELKQIASVYNLAVKEIVFRDHKLTEYAASLAEKVEERTKERDLQRMKAVNSARLASLGEMSAGVAHEINNPLAIIDMSADKIEKVFKKIHPEPDAEISKQIDRIHSMVTRIAKIIKGLRAFARDGSQDPLLPFSVTKLLDDVKDLCQTRIAKSDIQFEIRNSLATGRLGIGREVQVSQVLINLINNALDAIATLETKWIHVDVTERGQMIHFSVTDSGSGIPPEVRAKLMQPFFTTKEIGKGTGLGLSISQGIVKEHGGEFVLRDDTPHTCFEFSIPLSKSDEGAPHDEAA